MGKSSSSSSSSSNPLQGSITNQPTVSEPTSYSHESSPEPDKHTFTLQARPRRMSAHAEADADRAMRRTNSWTPTYERRHSWSKEDHKHAMQLASIGGVKTGPGFSER